MLRTAQIKIFLLGIVCALGLASVFVQMNLVFVLSLCLLINLLLVWVMKGQRSFLVLLIFLFGLLIGLMRISVELFECPNLVDQDWLNLQVKVLAEIKEDGQSQTLLVDIQQGDLAGRGFGKALWRRKSFEAVQIGQVFSLKTKLEKIVVEQQDYWRPQKVCWQLINASNWKVVGEGSWVDFLNQQIVNWRLFLVSKLEEVFDKNTAALVAGILLGQRSNLDKGILADFQMTGLTHVLAVSGFNVTLLINVVSVLLVTVGRGRKVLISLCLIWVFVLLTGASASVVRAGMMGSLSMLVTLANRKPKIEMIILLSVVLMCLVSPLMLAFDLSFQLSALATLSLIWFADSFEKNVLLSWPELIREGVLTTLAAQVLTLPITSFNFGRISLISPLANLLIIPTIPVLMLGSFLVTVLGFINVELAIWLGGLVNLMVGLILQLVHYLAKIPLASVELGQGDFWLAIIYFQLLFKFFGKPKLVPRPSLDHGLTGQSISN